MDINILNPYDALMDKNFLDFSEKLLQPSVCLFLPYVVKSTMPGWRRMLTADDDLTLRHTHSLAVIFEIKAAARFDKKRGMFSLHSRQLTA